MDRTKLTEYAQELLRAHGDQAEAEAAKKAARCSEDGNTDQAAMWNSVRSVIAEMRGPRAT